MFSLNIRQLLHHRGGTHRVLLGTLFLLSAGNPAAAGGKIGIYGLYMAPYGVDAREYSRPGWGFGLHVVLPLPQLDNVLAGTAGIEYLNLLNSTTTFVDRLTHLRTEQQTEQSCCRFYIGGQVGGHGNALLRPHAGANVALVWYNISTDVVIPDDYNRENEVRQNLKEQNHLCLRFGCHRGTRCEL